MKEKKEAQLRADYERLTGRTDYEEFQKLSPWQRIKFMRNPPVDGDCELHIEQNLARASGLGTTNDLRWHWWISAPDGRVVHSDYQFTMKSADRMGRKWAQKHSIHLKGS
jgi:hypothetical protein